MHCRDCFERIRIQACDIARAEADIADLESRAQIKGGALGGSHGGGSGDRMAAMDRAIDLSRSVDVAKAQLARRIEAATDILYGPDGRGGLARARCTGDADIICRYYLQGASWDDVAEECARPDSSAPKKWCQMRARRALDYMARVGGATLTNF